MSKLFLPGDPPPQTPEQQIANAYAGQRREMGRLTAALILAVQQYGTDGKLILDPPTVKRRSYVLSINPDNSGGAEIILNKQDDSAAGNPEGNGEKIQ